MTDQLLGECIQCKAPSI